MTPTGKRSSPRKRGLKTSGKRPGPAASGGKGKRILGFVLKCGVAFVVLSFAGVLVFRFLPVWITPYMAAERIRAFGAEDKVSLYKKWVSYDKISGEMALAVVAAEDQKFFSHSGFDFTELRKALESEGKQKRGASTITQQVAKNLFLWHGRSYIRKGLEAWFTVLIEFTWPKERILEVYLNIAETGNMTFGVEAAAQLYFNIPADKLSRSQAARIAASLPNPKVYKADTPGPYVRKRATWIERQMRNLGSIERLKKLKN